MEGLDDINRRLNRLSVQLFGSLDQSRIQESYNGPYVNLSEDLIIITQPAKKQSTSKRMTRGSSPKICAASTTRCRCLICYSTLPSASTNQFQGSHNSHLRQKEDLNDTKRKLSSVRFLQIIFAESGSRQELKQRVNHLSSLTTRNAGSLLCANCSAASDELVKTFEIMLQLEEEIFEMRTRFVNAVKLSSQISESLPTTEQDEEEEGTSSGQTEVDNVSKYLEEVNSLRRRIAELVAPPPEIPSTSQPENLLIHDDETPSQNEVKAESSTHPRTSSDNGDNFTNHCSDDQVIESCDEADNTLASQVTSDNNDSNPISSGEEDRESLKRSKRQPTYIQITVVRKTTSDTQNLEESAPSTVPQKRPTRLCRSQGEEKRRSEGELDNMSDNNEEMPASPEHIRNDSDSETRKKRKSPLKDIPPLPPPQTFRQTQDGRTFFKHVELMTTEDGQFRCGICDNRSFKTKQSIKMHINKRHVESNRFKCKQCGKGFYYSQSLEEHSYSSHANISTDGRLQCEICGKTFCDRSTKSKHVKVVHEGIRPFFCEHCGNKFSRKKNLVIHLRTHTGERPFICDVCGNGFITKQRLQRHTAKNHPTTIKK